MKKLPTPLIKIVHTKMKKSNLRDIKTLFLPVSICGGLGLGLDGVEVDKVNDRRSSDKISKLCERRPESTIEFSPISGDEALEFEDVFGVVEL